MSVERLEQDRDADEHADADHVRTERPVESEQSIGLFTQRGEVDTDFRVSGLPHAVVKQAENFRREFVKKVESHPHRQALQADLQQNHAYNPFSEKTNVMICEMGNVELSKQFRKCNAQNAFFIGIKELSIALVDISWKKTNPVKVFTNGDWMLSQSRTTSSRESDFVMLGTTKLRHRNSISWPTMRGGMYQKRNLKEFTIASNEIRRIVIRNSKNWLD